MFANKDWTLSGIKTVLSKIDATGTVERRSGSGQRMTRSPDTISDVQDLVLSQDDKPKTHSSQRQIARQTGVSLGSMNRIIHNDLRLTCLKRRPAQELTVANKIARREHCLQLLERYLAGMVNLIWFTDEKIFTVATPSNTQNDRLYVPAGVIKKNVAAGHLLHTRPTFSKSVMMSVRVSSLRKTSLHFVDPGIKTDGRYYRDVLLTKCLLPEIRGYSEYFTLQQDGAPAYRARETVKLLKQATPDFIPSSL